MPRVSIQIVTWNSLRFLPDCLESIFNQTFRDWSVLIIDNNSSDHSVDYVEKNWPQVKALKNSRNAGFARANNQGIASTDSEYVLVMNPDVILEPEFLTEIITIADKKKRAASLAPKLLKMKFHHIDHCDHTTQEQQSSGAMINPDWCVIKTDILDSTGLLMKKTRRFVDRGEGEKDEGQYDKQTDIFGASGACVLYRRKSLADVKMKDVGIREEYFDEDFFAYQEDVDLAWRLKWRGWQAIYAPSAIAYHVRQISATHRFQKSGLVNFLSYRNHLWLLVKNEALDNFCRNFFYIFGYQTIKVFYLLFTQPGVLLRGEFSYWSRVFLMLKKRGQIMRRRRISSAKIREYIE